jgi:hypothetical protein
MSDSTWGHIERALEEIEADLGSSQTDNDVRAIGTKCRETIISLARLVFDPDRHSPGGEAQPGTSDGERMLELFFNSTLDGSTSAEGRGFVRALLKLSHAVVHRRPAAKRDAQLAVLGLRSLCDLVAVLSDQGQLSQIEWEGVRVGRRFFAWAGPTLHALPDRSPSPTPNEVLMAIRGAGYIPSYGVRAKLVHHLSEGALQVYETDKRTWRREMITPPEGQLLMVKPAHPAEGVTP